MKNIISLFGDITYNHIPFTMLGFSGGSKQYPPYDYIPDVIIFIHPILLN